MILLCTLFYFSLSLSLYICVPICVCLSANGCVCGCWRCWASIHLSIPFHHSWRISIWLFYDKWLECSIEDPLLNEEREREEGAKEKFKFDVTFKFTSLNPRRKLFLQLKLQFVTGAILLPCLSPYVILCGMWMLKKKIKKIKSKAYTHILQMAKWVRKKKLSRKWFV